LKVYDYIIIGAGVAGLNAAANIPKEKKVLVITKQSSWDCNSFYAQGGVAVPINENDIELHISDTLNAGANYGDREATEILCKDGIGVINDLIKSGFEFDKDENGNLLYTKEAAHSSNRILHAGGDATGRCLHQFLLQNSRFELLSETIVTDFLLKNNVCYGITLFRNNKFTNIYGNNILIASGGVGSLYEFNTNAKTVSADIHGICIEKGCELKDMEMMQFHPTVFVKSSFARKQLISEAVRGEGGLIVDSKGERFLFDYDGRGELSPRDIVSRAIFDKKLKTGGEVYLSLANFTKDGFAKRFPSINGALEDIGFKIPEDKIPISPAFHYAIGGIRTNLNGKIGEFKNLFAIGEVANTGVHGANRLASNSLLEALVFSKRAVAYSLKENFKPQMESFEVNDTTLIKSKDKQFKNELRKIMWQSVGIVRKNSTLKTALQRVEEMLKMDIGRLLRLRLLTSKFIIESAVCQEKSIGTHYKIKEN